MKRKQNEIDYSKLSEKELDELMRKEHEEEMNHLASLGKITYKFQREARKSHFCSICGCEIHRHELVWWWKPYPRKIGSKVIHYKWRTNCWEHEPMRYNVDDFDEDVCEGSYAENGYERW